jgi:hypothetical protein
MKVSRVIWQAQMDLLAADTATLGASTAMNLHLANANFTPSLDLAVGSLSEATFVGSTKIACGTGAQPVYYDVLTGNRVVEILEPAGGFRWTCTTSPGSPETIYGYYLTDHTDAVLYGSALLSAPVTISAAGQGLDIGSIKLAWSTNSPM